MNPIISSETVATLEKVYVKEFYDKHAEHFSQTRYKSWPSVKEFIDGLPENSLVLDAGCGNGKNMFRDDITLVGCDISEGLLKICLDKGLNVFQADLRDLPCQDDSYDYVISIAVIHHLGSFDDRVKACQELVRVCKPGNQIFIQVWQDCGIRNKKFQPINDDGDYFVTWTDKETQEVSKRFYHMFREEEIDELVNSLEGVTLEKKFVEAKNFVVILTKE